MMSGSTYTCKIKPEINVWQQIQSCKIVIYSSACNDIQNMLLICFPWNPVWMNRRKQVNTIKKLMHVLWLSVNDSL